jgi:hypothetical protein
MARNRTLYLSRMTSIAQDLSRLIPPILVPEDFERAKALMDAVAKRIKQARVEKTALDIEAFFEKHPGLKLFSYAPRSSKHDYRSEWDFLFGLGVASEAKSEAKFESMGEELLGILNAHESLSSRVKHRGFLGAIEACQAIMEPGPYAAWSAAREAAKIEASISDACCGRDASKTIRV